MHACMDVFFLKYIIRLKALLLLKGGLNGLREERFVGRVRRTGEDNQRA